MKCADLPRRLFQLSSTLYIGLNSHITNVTIRGATDNFNDVASYSNVPMGILVWNAQNVTIVDLSIGEVYHPIELTIELKGDVGASKTRRPKRRTFDVFLCHNSEDKPVVKDIGERLKERRIRPWLDEWELRPGMPWQKSLENQIQSIKAAAVFVGPNGIGPWQDRELDALLREFVNRRCPIIPVILPECKTTPKLPPFLAGMSWVDFRKEMPDPLERLIWGITGKRVD